jgi:hypothetical protein
MEPLKGRASNLLIISIISGRLKRNNISLYSRGEVLLVPSVVGINDKRERFLSLHKIFDFIFIDILNELFNGISFRKDSNKVFDQQGSLHDRSEDIIVVVL